MDRAYRCQDAHRLPRHLNSPFGITLVGYDLYVDDTDALLRCAYLEAVGEGVTNVQVGQTVLGVPDFQGFRRPGRRRSDPGRLDAYFARP